MRWGPAARRRAEAFDTLAEAASARPGQEVGPADRELLELVSALRAAPAPTPRSDFATDLRAALLAEAEAGQLPAERPAVRTAQRRPARQRRLTALVAGVAVAGVTTGVAVASQDALPGDALYPVKRVLERAHTDLSVGERDQGSTVLANASDRLDEVDALARQDGFGDDVRIAETLDTFSDQATQGADLLLSDFADHGTESSVADVRDFASSSLDRLAALEPLVPAAARTALLDAARTLQRIDAEARQSCPGCGGTPITSIPTALTAAPAYVVLPAPPTVEPAPGRGRDHQGGSRHPDGDGATAGPAGGGGASDSPAPSPTASAGQTTGPVEDLTDGLQDGLGGVLGGGGTSGPGPSRSPSLPIVDDLVDEVDDVLGSVLDPLTGD